MPGLARDDMENTLVIKGEEKQESEGKESSMRSCSRIELPPNVYKPDGIKAAMRNGVLKVIVPKVREEEKTDVLHHVNIDLQDPCDDILE
uniref:SHSP domain-containing protein n=1 Tax=Kalanchoe fedtschenkoi TaxID=63787 RepID=A0A7N0VJ43_KALFE